MPRGSKKGPQRARDTVKEKEKKGKITDFLSMASAQPQISPAPNVLISPPFTRSTSLLKPVSDNPDPVVAAIAELSAKFDQNTGQLNSKLDKIVSDIEEWKTGIEKRVSQNEATIKDREKLMQEMKASIDFMDKTARDTQEQSQTIDITFQNIAKLFQNERLSTVKNMLKLEERVNMLEREVRSFNIRVQGLKIPDAQNIKSVVVKTFSNVVPQLTNSHIEYVYKLPTRKVTTTPKIAGGDEDGDGEDGEQVKTDDDSPILLVRFTDKNIRNQVFFKSKKFKFDTKLILRDDHIKSDHDKWTKAKPQMSEAHVEGKKSKYKWGKLTINSQQIPIRGVESEATILANALEESTLKIVRKKRSE